jgi:WD40 repeat protein
MVLRAGRRLHLTKGTSRIVRFYPAAAMTSNGIVTTEATDAEQPVVAGKGELLAYIREVQGRGSLWIRPLLREEDGDQTNPERQLAGPQYDVRDAAFSPDEKLVFSSWHSNRYRLYSVNPQSGSIAELTSVNCSARYPAPSPDGHWIAFSCERGGVWQLVALNLATAGQFQLTGGDCNSITPAWSPDSKSLIYATDCGRALGITALSKLSVVR